MSAAPWKPTLLPGEHIYPSVAQVPDGFGGLVLVATADIPKGTVLIVGKWLYVLYFSLKKKRRRKTPCVHTRTQSQISNITYNSINRAHQCVDVPIMKCADVHATRCCRRHTTTIITTAGRGVLNTSIGAGTGEVYSGDLLRAVAQGFAEPGGGKLSCTIAAVLTVTQSHCHTTLTTRF